MYQKDGAMQISGRRIHIAGSAHADTDSTLVKYGHDLVDQLVWSLAEQGATFVVGVGKEPHVDPEDPFSLSTVFDWTALAATLACIRHGSVPPTGSQGPLVATVVTSKTDGQIPNHHRPIWEDLRAAHAI